MDVFIVELAFFRILPQNVSFFHVYRKTVEFNAFVKEQLLVFFQERQRNCWNECDVSVVKADFQRRRKLVDAQVSRDGVL